MQDLTFTEYRRLLEKDIRLQLLKVFIEQEDKQSEKDGYKHGSLDTSFMRKLLGMEDYERTV